MAPSQESSTETGMRHQEEVPEPEQQLVEEILSTLVLTSSSSSSEEAISYDTTPLSSGDFNVYQELLKRMAADLDAQVEEVMEPLPDVLSLVHPSRLALPINKAILELIKALGQTLSSLP